MKKSAKIMAMSIFCMVCVVIVTVGNVFGEACGAGLKSVKTEGAKTLLDPVKIDGDKYKVLLENEKVRVLVATNDDTRNHKIPNVTHVINFDQPKTNEDYVHRIGRTGRGGASGPAHTFIHQ